MSKNKFLKSQVHIRAATSTDIGFLFNSWLKSYKASLYVKSVPGVVYFDAHHKVVENILKRSTVLIAANPADHNQIFGYLCFEQIKDVFVIHYCYTKEAFRQMGLQSLLLEHANIPRAHFYSHSTKLFSDCIKKQNQTAVFNPYLQQSVVEAEENDV